MLKITKNQGSIQVTADKSGFYPFDGTITFPINSLFTATSANTDMITFKSTSNGDVQFVGNYKDITISGRSYDTKQKFLTAFSNLANQGSVDAYTKAETDAKIDAKQGKLKAGNGITLTEDATDNTTVVKTAVSLTDNGEGAYTVGDSIKMGSDTVVIGKSAISRSKTSIAIGKSATSGSGGTNVAIGNIANSSGGSSIAIGNKTETSNFNAIAIGTLAGAYLTKSIAIGYNAKTSTNIPMVINAGSKTMIQGDANGKISLLKGDGTDTRMVIQDEIEALKNAGGGSVDAYTKAETDTKLDAKQDKLTAGSGITIDENNVISSTGGSGGGANPLVNVKGTGSATIPDDVIEAVAIGSGARTSSGRSVAIGYKAETSAGTPMVINASSKTMIQGDANGKISILKGDGTDTRMVIQDEIEALKNAGGSGGTVDAYTKAETDTKLDAKQDKLTAGTGITIDENNVISSTGGSGGGANPLVAVNGTNGDATISDSVTDAVAIGGGANVSRNYGVSVGSRCKSGDRSVAIGSSARSESSSSIAIGDGANTGMFINNNTIAVGTNARANSSNSLAIGKNAAASTDTPMVINAGSKTMIQGDSTGKISILLGDGTDTRMVIQDEIAALKAEIAALKGGASTGA